MAPSAFTLTAGSKASMKWAEKVTLQAIVPETPLIAAGEGDRPGPPQRSAIKFKAPPREGTYYEGGLPISAAGSNPQTEQKDTDAPQNCERPPRVPKAFAAATLRTPKCQAEP
jgi:hypothetical protein